MSSKKIDTQKPLISIVTFVLNGQTYLEQCVLSVMSQDYRDIEHVIVDGGVGTIRLEDLSPRIKLLGGCHGFEIFCDQLNGADGHETFS